MYNIVEIFDSLEGEGLRQGLAATFIRFAGCNLKCSWCDTAHAQTLEKATQLSELDVVKKVNLNFRRITLTGGEPLIQKDVTRLIRSLLGTNSMVNIETNGSVDISPFQSLKNLFFSIDYKLASSGENYKMLESNYLNLKQSDCIKFVVSDEKDVNQASDFIKKIYLSYVGKKDKAPQSYMTVTDKNLGGYILEQIIKYPHLKNLKVYTQLHKELRIR